jgi:hypothetical protein
MPRGMLVVQSAPVDPSREAECNESYEAID